MFLNESDVEQKKNRTDTTKATLFKSILVFPDYQINTQNTKVQLQEKRRINITKATLCMLVFHSFNFSSFSLGLQVYFKATDPFNEKWQSAWIITAFWDILAFALLCVICYLWAPSQSSQRCVVILNSYAINMMFLFLFFPCLLNFLNEKAPETVVG